MLDDGREIVAHCPSPGGMVGLAEPGSRVWCRHAPSPRRKLAWTWELATDGDVLVAFDGVRANRIVAQAVAAALIDPLRGYERVEREVRQGSSRIDLRLSGHPTDPRPCWVEVKTSTLGRGDGLVVFPDAPTARGARHLGVLAERAAAGERAVAFYLTMRSDARRWAPAKEIDPGYAAAHRQAVAAGVEIVAWRADPSPEGISVAGPLQVAADL